MDFDSFTTVNLDRYDFTSVYTHVAYDKRTQSRVQKTLDGACSTDAAIIRKIENDRILAEMLALEYRLQMHDLERYAKTPEAEQSIKQGLKDLEAGFVNYNALTEQAQQYRHMAAGYTDRLRDKKLDVPKDGMRAALASQLTRLQNRQSLNLSDAETDILTARRSLINSINMEYSQLQVEVIHGRQRDNNTDNDETPARKKGQPPIKPKLKK